MQCYTELIAPTGVTHSLSLPFLSPSANNLVVAKTSLLQIYSLKSVIAQEDESSKPQGQGARSSERRPTTRLVLIAEYNLSGTITSLARVKILRSKSGGEALLVALRDAKLSLIEWDPERYSISTVSIHYYERNNIVGEPWEPDISECVNYLSVDPGSRCAALKFGARHLAILPFHQLGDDLIMDEDNFDVDSKTTLRDNLVPAKAVNGDQKETPYAASFVLSLLALDPALTHPIHLSFLYEYREPAFGILFSQSAASSALLHERNDVVSFAVYTLDLEQKASTTLLSINNLPYDLHTIVPLSRAIGGVLLVGGNEIIHVDQSGKTSGVAVNDITQSSTSFPLSDQSELNLRLEGSTIQQLGFDNKDMLVVLKTGELAIISFTIDGRSVSGISVRLIGVDNGGLCMRSGATCASIVGRGRIFVGSESTDSAVLGWSRASDRSKRRRSRIEGIVEDYEEPSDLYDGEMLDEDEDEDDLYANDKREDSAVQQIVSSSSNGLEDDYTFRVHDTLQTLGAMTDVTFPSILDAESERQHSEILTTSGYGRAGKLISIHGEIVPKHLWDYDIAEAEAIWTLCPKAGDTASGRTDSDRYLVTTATSAEGHEYSKVYIDQEGETKELQDKDFDPEGKTVEVATLNNGTRIVQVLHDQIRAYDGNFGLAQIFPLADEDVDKEPKVVSANFADPYVLLTFEDRSIRVLRSDDSGDIEEIEQGTARKDSSWICGSLYEDANDLLRLDFGDDEDVEASNVLMFLLSTTGALKIFRLPNLHTPVYGSDGLSFLPSSLDSDFVIRRASTKDNIIDLMVAELGDATQKGPHLMLRSALNDIIIYQPFQSPVAHSTDTTLRFVKITDTLVAPASSDHNEVAPEGSIHLQARLRALPDLDGIDMVFVPSPSASLITKTASSMPRVMPLADAQISSLARYRSSKNPSGFVYIDASGASKAASLPPHKSYTTGMALHTISIGCTVSGITHHASTQTYVMTTSSAASFNLPGDEQHPSQYNPETTSLLPETSQDLIQLFNTVSQTFISTYTLDQYETALCINTASLEISEKTHERAQMVAVGTCLIKGEDLPTMGRIYVFAVIPVVPDPDIPGTNFALKLVNKEEVRGAVTAVSGVGSQGFLMVAQGQKILIRGLKEDGTFLPVAFLDVMCYVVVAKELNMGVDAAGQGLCLMADALKGIWLAGYMEDPYQLRLFGKSPHHIESIAADFLPDGKQLYIVVADADCNLQVLHFDPENPKSLGGTRLLRHASFHTPSFPSTLTLLPANFSFGARKASKAMHRSADDEGIPQRSILITSQSGSLALLTPIPEASHRTLTALQSHCQNTLPHALGLNPRSFRSCGDVDSGIGIGRSSGGVIDGNVIRRWEEGGSWKRWAGEERGVVREMVREAVGGGLWM